MDQERRSISGEAGQLRAIIATEIGSYAGSPDATGKDKTNFSDETKRIIAELVLQVAIVSKKNELQQLAEDIDALREEKDIGTEEFYKHIFDTAFHNQKKDQSDVEIFRELQPRFAEGLTQASLYPHEQTIPGGSCAKSVMEQIAKRTSNVETIQNTGGFL